MVEANTKTARRGSSRQAILEAAGNLVAEVGSSHMTLEAVAARAGVSKGGLLYNFPNKTALLEAMIEESITEAAAVLAPLAENSEADPGQFMRALIALRFRWLMNPEKDCYAHGMLAAVAEQPALLGPVRRIQSALWERIKAIAPDPDKLWLIWLATEGLLSSEIFGVTPLSAEERSRICARITNEADTLLAGLVPQKAG